MHADGPAKLLDPICPEMSAVVVTGTLWWAYSRRRRTTAGA